MGRFATVAKITCKALMLLTLVSIFTENAELFIACLAFLAIDGVALVIIFLKEDEL